MEAGGTPVTKCLRHALRHGPMVRTAFLTALVVGSVLTAINQGNLILSGDVSGEHVWKIPLTYLVPYCVATFGALRISRLSGDGSPP